MREALRVKREDAARRERAGFAEDKLTLEPATQGKAGNARYIEPVRNTMVHLGHGHGGPGVHTGRAILGVVTVIALIALMAWGMPLLAHMTPVVFHGLIAGVAAFLFLSTVIFFAIWSQKGW